MRLSCGARLGTYEILGSLGAGGMGEVYRARDTRLRRNVAIKVLPVEVASSPGRLARFEREARIVAALNHPNIVTLLSFEDEAGIHFLTMELVQGQSLEYLITPGGLPLSRVVELSISIADALAAAHEKGVIHRDLKPSNVMVTAEGRVKVLDFGLAKVAGSGADPEASTLTATAEPLISRVGQVMGTVPYMAPEQIRGETVDARTDFFALGIMIYELATGARPFIGPTSADVISAILRDTPVPIASGRRADLVGELDEIAGRCLRKDPRDRPQTASDVRTELRRLKQRLDDRAATYDLHVRGRDDFPFLGYDEVLDGVVAAAGPKPSCSVLDLASERATSRGASLSSGARSGGSTSLPECSRGQPERYPGHTSQRQISWASGPSRSIEGSI